MEYESFSAKTVSDAITEACTKLGVPSDMLDYEVVEEGSSGFLGFASKDAVIKARIKSDDNEPSEKSVKAEEKKAEAPAGEAAKEVPEETKEEETKKAEPFVEKRVIKPVNEEHGKELCEKAKVFLTDVCNAMGITSEIETSFDTSENSMDVTISGDDMGVLIAANEGMIEHGQIIDKSVFTPEQLAKYYDILEEAGLNELN